MSRALIFLALVAPASAAVCAEEWKSIFHWLDSSLRSEFTYDLRPLCAGPNGQGQPDLKFTVPIPSAPQNEPWTFLWTVGGNISQRCNPTWTNYYSASSFLQMWDLTKPSNRGYKIDPETGKNTSITPPCEILANTRPIFDVVDPSNPQTGGIKLSYSAEAEAATDGNKCPPDTRFGGYLPRVLTVILQCDATLDPSVANFVSWSESSPCVYTAVFNAGAACGVAGDPYAVVYPATPGGAAAAAAQQAGVNFGYVVLGGVLFAGAQWALVSGALAGALASAGLHSAAGFVGKARAGGGGGGIGVARGFGGGGADKASLMSTAASGGGTYGSST